MKRKFIVDEEIQLIEGNDFLNTKLYSDTLKKIILNAPKDKPFTIGLFGEWGSGKSSIIKTVKNDLESDQKNKFVIFDAWKYGGDAFRRSFILSVAATLGVTLDKKKYNLYEDITEQIEEIKIKIPKIYYWITGILLLLIALCYIFSAPFRNYSLNFFALVMLTITSCSIFAFAKGIVDKDLIGKLLGFFRTLVYSKYDVEKPLMFSPEQFSNAFEKIVEEATKKYDRLIIVIDNIDRCDKHYASELLGTIKGFLEYKEKVLFVLPVDESALKRHIKGSFNAHDNEADEFLRKFFSVNLRIKPFQTEQMYDLAEKINSKYSLNFNKNTLDLVSKEYATNPRRIIQIFNNLSTELTCFSEKFSKENETIICKLLIIREEFTDYFNAISRNPFLLHNPDAKIHAYVTNDSQVKLFWFLHKTKIITEAVPMKILMEVFSNSSVFNELPNGIRNAVDSLQTTAVIEFMNDDVKSELVINYLVRQLEIYTERGLFETSFINTLELIYLINDHKTFDLSIHLRIEAIISNHLHQVHTNAPNLQNLVKYSYSVYNLDRPYLLKELTKTTGYENTVPEAQTQKSIQSLKSIIETYNEPTLLSPFKKAFASVYEHHDDFTEFRNMSELQLQSLISPELKSFLISKVSDIDTADRYFGDLMYLLDNTITTESTEKEIVAKINELYPNLDLKEHVVIGVIINKINFVLEHLKQAQVSNEDLQKLYDLITGNRTFPNPSYPNNAGYNQQINFVDDHLHNQEIVALLCTFWKNVYRLSNGSIDTEDLVTKLSSSDENRSILNLSFAELLTTHDFTAFADIILADTIYTAESFILFRSIFENNSEEYKISDEDLRTKISEIFDLVLNDEEKKPEAQAFLSGICDDDRCKQAVTSIISEQTRQNIFKLPLGLQTLAFDMVLPGDQIFDYQDDTDFLKALASNGDSKHVKKLQKVLISKLQKESEFENAISIISELKKLSSGDAEGLLRELKRHDTKETLKVRLEDVMKHIAKIKV